MVLATQSRENERRGDKNLSVTRLSDWKLNENENSFELWFEQRWQVSSVVITIETRDKLVQNCRLYYWIIVRFPEWAIYLRIDYLLRTIAIGL